MPGQDHEKLLNAFRHAAEQMPWYRLLLNESGVNVSQVVDAASFSRLCPLLTKQNTFNRFSLDQLAATTKPHQVASVLTSSGHGGQFSFGIVNRAEAVTSAAVLDEALDAAFGIKSRSTLAINCLPMGVGFTSECMTVGTVSVREDMALALIRAFGSQYDQVLLAADPRFMKRLTDYGAEQEMDWERYRIHVIFGEEVFGEHFRGYVASCLGQDMDKPEGGRIISSFGVGEIGLHLCFETPATIALRRAAWKNPDLARDLLGVSHSGETLPAILAFNPARTFVEVVGPDRAGYGRLTISALDMELAIPLLRYQTGDVARLLDPETLAGILRRHDAAVPRELPSSLLALQGRTKERIPNGSHVGVYKDALYADHAVAREITGAFRVIASENECTLHVQLVASAAATDSLARRLRQAIPEPARPDNLVLWPYGRFPFGMTVDYERKFAYYVAGERLPSTDDSEAEAAKARVARASAGPAG
jgi:phenylacetate-CoA ligase